MAAEPGSDHFSRSGSAGDVPGDAAQVVGGELLRQRIEPFIDGGFAGDGFAQVVVKDLGRA